ncbi:MAG TPA: hypothetical protein VHE12_03955 [bacterium]|nr:hypothetical protein [bacterium]
MKKILTAVLALGFLAVTSGFVMADDAAPAPVVKKHHMKHHKKTAKKHVAPASTPAAAPAK